MLLLLLLLLEAIELNLCDSLMKVNDHQRAESMDESEPSTGLAFQRPSLGASSMRRCYGHVACSSASELHHVYRAH